jgi:hypothetical protein
MRDFQLLRIVLTDAHGRLGVRQELDDTDE